jgi:hypothetical protein
MGRRGATSDGNGNDATSGRDANPSDRNGPASVEGFRFVDPASIAGSSPGNGPNGDSGAGASDTGSAPKRRGRPAGSKNKATKADLSSFTSLLVSLHNIAAIWVEELEIEEDEAEKLAKAIAEVQSHYPVTVIDPKWLSLSNLVIVTSGIYGPAFMAYRLRKYREKSGSPKPTVIPFPQAME